MSFFSSMEASQTDEAFLFNFFRLLEQNIEDREIRNTIVNNRTPLGDKWLTVMEDRVIPNTIVNIKTPLGDKWATVIGFILPRKQNWVPAVL